MSRTRYEPGPLLQAFLAAMPEPVKTARKKRRKRRPRVAKRVRCSHCHNVTSLGPATAVCAWCPGDFVKSHARFRWGFCVMI